METVASSRRNMIEIARRSNGLWRTVNATIARVLSRHQSRDRMVRALNTLAGPEKRSEPVCVGNYRIAAAQLRDGNLVSVT